MVTNFNLFENKTELNIDNKIKNNNNVLTENIIDYFSLIIYKQNRKLKNLRIKKLEGYYDKRVFKNFNLIYKTKIIVKLSNYDIIIGELSLNKNGNNNIKVKINDKIVYDLDNSRFDNEKMIKKMYFQYKNHIEKNYKIK